MAGHQAWAGGLRVTFTGPVLTGWRRPPRSRSVVPHQATFYVLTAVSGRSPVPRAGVQRLMVFAFKWLENQTMVELTS